VRFGVRVRGRVRARGEIFTPLLLKARCPRKKRARKVQNNPTKIKPHKRLTETKENKKTKQNNTIPSGILLYPANATC
jgi:hypothetical protein